MKIRNCPPGGLFLWQCVGWTTIVITKVSYSLVLSLLLSVVLSLSKVKWRQKIKSQDHLAKWTDVNHQPKYTTVLHLLTLRKVSTDLRYNTGQDYLASSTYLTSLCLRAIPLTSHWESLFEHCRCCSKNLLDLVDMVYFFLVRRLHFNLFSTSFSGNFLWRFVSNQVWTNLFEFRFSECEVLKLNSNFKNETFEFILWLNMPFLWSDLT